MVKLGILVDGEHVRTNESGVRLIADSRCESCPFDAALFPRDACKVEERIGSVCSIQARALFDDILRHIAFVHESQRCIGSISESTLSKQLKELAEDGFLERIDYGEVPPRVEYRLTSQGESFIPILLAMKKWGEEELGL